MSQSQRGNSGHHRGQPRGGSGGARHRNTQSDRNTINPSNQSSSAAAFGPQEGGFDTSGWGSYSNYYPIQNPTTVPTTNRHRNNRQQEQSGPSTTEQRPRSTQQNTQGRQQTGKNTIVPCDEYYSEQQVLQDIEAKKTIRGTLRINAKQYTDAFVTDPNGGNDFFIDNVRDRNRALNGDEVAAEIKPKREWKVIPEFTNLVSSSIREIRNDQQPSTDEPVSQGENASSTQASASKRDNKRQTIESLTKQNITLTDEMISRIPDEYFQRTVKVVYLFRRRHTMKAAGFLRKMGDENSNYALFSPMDSRIPRMMIPMNTCPPDFRDRPNDYEKSLFVAKILDIPLDKPYARGELMENLGDADTLDTQSRAILLENDVRDEEFSKEVIACLPLDEDQWKIPDEEYTKRLDLRDKCIFTIDPATARDLDDALSCEKLENGDWSIGVHIADVSYFVQEQTPLDIEASQRTTSVYLVERVIPMLPRLLCDRLCSLNPNEDRLTYSVIWRMNNHGQILDEKFTRSIIRSSAKLSYEHAQDIIEHPEKEFREEEFPPISPPNSLSQVKETILQLFRISKILRSKRAGALTLNQPKLQYQLTPDKKTPLSFSIYQQKDSHRLVEEFMLLANMQVAKKLCSVEQIFNKAILRRHPPPNITALQNTLKMFKSVGIEMEGKSSTQISEMINSLPDDTTKKLIIHLLAKSMQLAVYCCASCVQSKDYSHYALNVDYYTHFTSPIRRYPDILVHRALGALLHYNTNLYQTPQLLEQIAQTCNEKKINAKTCSERSGELYLAFLIKEYGTIVDQAVVVGVKDQSLDINIVSIGVAVRVGINNLPLDHPRTDYKPMNGEQGSELTIYWKDESRSEVIKQVLKPFTLIYVDITSEFDMTLKKMKLTARLRHPSAEKSTTLAELCTSSPSKRDEVILQRQDFDPYSEY